MKGEVIIKATRNKRTRRHLLFNPRRIAAPPQGVGSYSRAFDGYKSVYYRRNAPWISTSSSSRRMERPSEGRDRSTGAPKERQRPLACEGLVSAGWYSEQVEPKRGKAGGTCCSCDC
jgi:hypothetical protein